MAAVLPAPQGKVWPWLVQMGGGRAGWYSWDRLDNNGKPSADRMWTVLRICPVTVNKPMPWPSQK
jgi:hypothetical protein